jgi:hypothetical protein
MVPGFNLVLDRLFGLVDNKALFCDVDLGLPDLLHESPKTAGEIAAAIGADADALARLLRFLVTRGFFREQSEKYENNDASDVLRADHPHSFRDWVIFFGSEWNLDLWNRLPARVRTGKSPSHLAFGVPFFDYLSKRDRNAGRAFEGAMRAGSRLQALLFAEAIDLKNCRHVCDVGGGTGALVTHLLRVHPHLKGTVLDLPALEEDARQNFAQGGVVDRARFIGGDFFHDVPKDCDLYTLFAVIHDWGDDDCVRILANIRKSMSDDAKIIVVEGEVAPHQGEDFMKFADLLMLVFAEGGRERTRSEFRTLWEKAGFKESRRTALASGFQAIELAKS